MESAPQPPPASPSPAKFDGWLLLLAIGVAVNPITAIFSLITYLRELGVDGWNLFSGETQHVAGYATFMGFEIVGNILIAIASMLLAVVFFRKARRTPVLFIAMLLFPFCFNLVDALIAALTFGADLSTADYKAVLRSAVHCLIWVPYMIKSKRVRETFTREDRFIEALWRPDVALSIVAVLFGAALISVIQHATAPQ